MNCEIKAMIGTFQGYRYSVRVGLVDTGFATHCLMEEEIDNKTQFHIRRGAIVWRPKKQVRCQTEEHDRPGPRANSRPGALIA